MKTPTEPADGIMTVPRSMANHPFCTGSATRNPPELDAKLTEIGSADAIAGIIKPRARTTDNLFI
jgi:hypothetical protein